MPFSALTARLHEEFPLARHMQIEIAGWDHHTLTLTAPLAPNLNHADTAFGGSISSLGILAGYTLLQLALEERELSTRILIQKSATDFRRPIDDALVATAALPPAAAFEEFLDTLRKKRRARLAVDSQILCHQAPAAIHAGLYVTMIY